MRGRLIQQFRVVIRQLDEELSAAASVATSTIETWDFSGGDEDLEVDIDGFGVQVLTLVSASFAVPAAATAEEVAAQLDPQMAGGTAYTTDLGAVVLGTDEIGDDGSIEITGGAANARLRFPTTEVDGGGYDDIFGGYKPISDASQEGQSPRREKAPVTLPCQLRRPGNWGGQVMSPGGSEERADLIIALHKPDLEAAGLVNSDNSPVFQAGDRIARIENKLGEVEEAFPNPPGLFIVDVERGGFGLNFGGVARMNLVSLHCSKNRQHS